MKKKRCRSGVILSLLAATVLSFSACGSDITPPPAVGNDPAGNDPAPVTSPTGDDGNPDGTVADPDPAPDPDPVPDEPGIPVDVTTEYTPASRCTLDKRSDVTTSQLWIGRPSWTFVANNTPVRFHMPDKQLALFLGYIQELYGIDPNFMLSISGKESLAIFKDEDGTWLYPEAIEPNPDDGPFQFEMDSALAEMMQAFPSRVTSFEAAYHSNYVRNFNTSSVALALYVVWERAYLTECVKFHFDDFVAGATDRDVLFQSMAYGYNCGVFKNESSDGPFCNNAFDRMLVTSRAVCLVSGDVVDVTGDCGLNGESNYNVEVGNICMNLATADEVYDDTLVMNDISFFLERIAFTYPSADIDWNEVNTVAESAFDEMKNADGTISIRYHWIPLLRQILPLFPPAETPGGPFAGYMDNERCK